MDKKQWLKSPETGQLARTTGAVVLGGIDYRAQRAGEVVLAGQLGVAAQGIRSPTWA